MSTRANDRRRADEPGSVPPVPETTYLTCPGGRIGYDVAGDGPLVVLVPGMGDLRAGYRFLVPALRAAGYRVACTDLRGHGDSDATFRSHGDEETAGDITALIGELGGPAIVVGNSMGAGAAVLATAQRPGLVCGMVLARSSATARPAHCSGSSCARPWPRRGRLSPGSRICRSCTPAAVPPTSRSGLAPRTRSLEEAFIALTGVQS